MRIGKLSPDELRSIVFDNIRQTRPEVVVPAGLGEDSTVLDLGGELCVVSTDPITGASSGLGRLAVIIACNDVATSGADPVAVILTILAPPHSTLEEISLVMEQANQAAQELGVQIAGGHTEVTAAVNQMVLSTTSIGRVSKDNLLFGGKVTPDCSLLLVREAGLEGTSIIAHDYGELLQEFMSQDEISAAQELAEQLSVVYLCRIAAGNGAVAMHDVTEGGVLGAAYEMAQAAAVGLELTEEIPIHPLTRKICSRYGLDPLRLISSGAILVATRSPEQTMAALRATGVPVAVIGRFTNNAGKITRNERTISPPEGDELWTFKELVGR
jgi:hydrogenase expression/formation protein HypE